MRSLIIIPLFVCLFLGFTTAGQAQWAVKLYAGDNPGVTLDSLIIGLRADATYGEDTLLGEKELPPPPPEGAFDFRIKSFTRAQLGAGQRVDYHPLVRVTQTDTFKIAFSGSEGGGMVTFTWPAGLGSLGAGYWRLNDGQGQTLFRDIDMTAQTSFAYPIINVAQQFVYIITGDGKGFLLAASHDLAVAADSKGKIGKAEKRSNYKSEAEFQFNVTPADTPVTGMYVEYSAGILEHYTSSPFPLPAADPLGKVKKFTFTGSVSPGPINFHVLSSSKKGVIIKKAWFIPLKGGTPARPKGVPLPLPAPSMTKLWLRMPNWNNIGEEVYSELYPGGKGTGLVVGLTNQLGTTPKGKPIFKYIYHPKWSDVRKTLYEKGVEHAIGATACLDRDLKNNEIIKPYKSLPPSKSKANEMVSTLLAFKFNLAQSAAGHTGTGLGDMKLDISKWPGPDTLPPIFNGMTLSQLAARADSGISCTGPDEWTYEVNVMKYLMETFSRPSVCSTSIKPLAFPMSICPKCFDTLTYAVQTTTEPAKAVAEEPLVYRPTAGEVAPIGNLNLALMEQPSRYELLQNYPNPFNPATSIEFSLPEDALVTLKVYNILGQEVATLADREQFTEGSNVIEFEASELASGVYFYRLIVDEGRFQQVRKMVLLR